MSCTTDTDLQRDAAACISYSTAVPKRKDSFFQETCSSGSATPRKRIEHPTRQRPVSSSGQSRTSVEELHNNSGTRPMISGAKEPVGEVVRQTHTSTPTTETSSSDVQLQPQPSQRQVIMICLASKLGLFSLYQVQMKSPQANADIFKRLSAVYKDEREAVTFWRIKIIPFWRFVAAIHFVRFRIHRPVPTRVEITDMHSLPDGAPGWACGLDTHDSISETIMASYLYHPSEISEGLRWSVYEWLPRKLNGPLQAESGLQGWGLYFEERWRWDVIVLSATTLFFAGDLIRILVGVAKGDESYGISLGSSNMVLLGGVVSLVGLIHAVRRK